MTLYMLLYSNFWGVNHHVIFQSRFVNCMMQGAIDLDIQICVSCWHAPLTWWRNQVETFSALLAICAGNSPVPGEVPAQRPVTQSFHVFWMNRWVNTRKAGDLRRYHAHYDVLAMSWWPSQYSLCVQTLAIPLSDDENKITTIDWGRGRKCKISLTKISFLPRYPLPYIITRII